MIGEQTFSRLASGMNGLDVLEVGSWLPELCTTDLSVSGGAAATLVRTSQTS